MKSSKFPVQAAPIERKITGAAMSNGNGVDPSINWGAVGSAALQALPSVLGAFGV